MPDYKALYENEQMLARRLLNHKESLLPLARLGAAVLEELRENASDIDGGDVFQMIQDFGVVVPEPVLEACDDHCSCAEFQGFPSNCYRDTNATALAKTIIKQFETNQEKSL